MKTMTPPPPHPTGYVEVTIALAMLMPDGTFLNGEMADMTLAFGLKSGPPPRELTQDEVRATVKSNLSRVAAAIQTILLTNGAVHLGQVDDPMTNHGRQYATDLSDPVNVRVDFVPEHSA